MRFRLHGARGECNQCTPSAAYCVDADTVATCNADGTFPSTDVACVYGCNGTRSECNGCVPSTTQCQGSNRVVCNADGTVASSTACPYGCVSGSCSVPMIDAGSF